MYDKLAERNHGGLAALLAMLAAGTVAQDPLGGVDRDDPDAVVDSDFGNFSKAACVEHWRRERAAGVPREEIERNIDDFIQHRSLAAELDDPGLMAAFKADTQDALDKIYGVPSILDAPSLVDDEELDARL